MRQDEWARAVVRTVADAVRWHRKRRKMSAQQLANECERLGYPVRRSVLANLENNFRESVSIPEWLILSGALQVPPMLMLFPIGRAEEIEPLPDVQMSPWEAVKWAETGHIVGIDGGPFQEDSDLIAKYRCHEEYIRAWEQAGTHIRQIHERLEKPPEWLEKHDAHPTEIRTELAAAEHRRRYTALVVKQVRAELTQARVLLPPLPPSLAAALDEQEVRPWAVELDEQKDRAW